MQTFSAPFYCDRHFRFAMWFVHCLEEGKKEAKDKEERGYYYAPILMSLRGGVTVYNVCSHE